MQPTRRQLAGAMVFAGLAGFAWARILGLWPALRPTNLTWLFQGDYVAYAFGWLFYRSAPWGFPLAQLPNLFAPDGTGVGFTDAIPWLAVTFKPFSGVLPESFHYFGLWAVGCYVLQGATGAWISTKLLRDPHAGALVGVLFVLSPPLTSRMGHLALLGHFLIVGAVGLGVLGTGDEAPGRRLKQALAITIIAAGVHPYLVAMVTPLCMALVVRVAFIERGVDRRRGLAWLAAVPGAGATTMWGLGYFSGSRDTLAPDGFGQFSADLLALINPWNNSRILPALGVGGRQYEGYAYLGLGVLLIGLITLIRLVRFRPARTTVLALLPTVVACLGLFFYSLSNIVTVAGKPVADLSALYAPLATFTAAFRSSGRFIWPLHELVLWLGVGALRAFVRWPVLRRGLLLLAVGLQFADLKPNHLDTDEHPLLTEYTLKDPAWVSAGHDYNHLALYPFHLQWVCRYDQTQVVRFGYEAWRRGLTFNSGLIGRVAKDVPTRCEKHLASFDAQTIYVATDTPFIVDLINAGFSCGLVDGYPICVSSQRPTPMLEAVRARLLR